MAAGTDVGGRMGLALLTLAKQCRTGERDPIDHFYRPCLSQAIAYARAVGYFRSSVFLVVGQALVDFAKRGGAMRLVCSPSITEEDAKAMASGYAQRDAIISNALARDVDELQSRPETSYRAKVLSTLVKCGAMDIRLAVRPNGCGIYHEKIGIFRDAFNHQVSFLGSANETWSAWHRDGNHEAIEVFCDWNDASEFERVAAHAAHFERLWAGEVYGLQTLPFPDAVRRRLLDFALPSLDDVERERLVDVAPRRTPLPHQLAAIEAWENAGRRGVLEHATGSGKTFTALIAIKKHIMRGQPALILVPSQLLLEQWASEANEELPDAVILLAGAGNDGWKMPGRLQAMTSNFSNEQRVVISTMQTAATARFLRSLSDGSHLILVADEIHQIGSAFNSRAMEIQSGASLGLSATPQRHGDPDGTAKIFERFGPIIPPPITLLDAIKAGRLVDYEYYPHAIHLSNDEAAEWKALTHKVSLEFAKLPDDGNGQRTISNLVKLLLIQRSRIAKKAHAKPGLAAAILKSYEEGQHWLVYCEDSDQLREVIAYLREIGVSPIEYHSAMLGDRDAAMEWFRCFGGVMVSIKCLDEGVDIPAISHVVILASSQNPRQFIQRRGRVLRKAQGKTIAIIHDAIVVPLNLANEPEQASLLRAEFIRALEFADSAINRAAGAQLRLIATSLGIDLEADQTAGIEEDDE